MIKTRNKSEESSLELLLDAMCNAFGGVMFIALLFIILSINAPDTMKSEEQQGLREEIMLTLERNIEETKSELNALYEEEHAKSGLVDDLDVDQQLISRFSELEKERKRLKGKLDRLVLEKEHKEAEYRRKRATLIEQESDIRQKHDQRRQFQEKVASNRNTLEQIEAELEEPVTAARSMDVSFARLREIENRNPFFVIVHDGKLFRISSYSRYLSPSGGVSEDVNYTFHEAFSKFEFHPAPQKGISIQNTSRRQLERYLSPIDENSFFISAFVRDDSFKEWLYLKRILQDKDFFYNWSPVIQREPCFVVIVDEEISYEGY